MTQPGETEEVVKEIYLDASPEVVFPYFTEAEKLTRWLCAEATTDPRPGGINHQTHPGDEVDSDGPYFMQGEFVELDFPNRVVFTWGYTNSSMGTDPGVSLVEVDLKAEGEGTSLRLVHSRIPAERARNAFNRGWEEMLDRLAAALS